MKFFLLFSFLFTVFLPKTSYADLPLRFKKLNNYKETTALSLIDKSADAEHNNMVARVDLNDDFIDEYVFRQKNCSDSTLCTHIIIAYMSKEPIEIGRFEARKIFVKTDKNFGIKQLTIYNDTYNDFANQKAFWDPYAFKYVYK